MSDAHALSRSFGHGLVNLGAQREDVVAVILPNMPEYAFVMFGASEAALRVTTLNPTYTPSKCSIFKRIYFVPNVFKRKSMVNLLTVNQSFL